MLANGATLKYSATETGTYTALAGLKELPDMGVDPEKVDNTTLSDTVKQYENGIGDVGDMVYRFKYDNSSATSAYRVLRGLETAGTPVWFEETLADGTKTKFKAQVSVKRTGGGVNGVVDFELGLALQSGLTITDPF